MAFYRLSVRFQATFALSWSPSLQSPNELLLEVLVLPSIRRGEQYVPD
jgi:hypothetical protein